MATPADNLTDEVKNAIDRCVRQHKLQGDAILNGYYTLAQTQQTYEVMTAQLQVLIDRLTELQQQISTDQTLALHPAAKQALTNNSSILLDVFEQQKVSLRSAKEEERMKKKQERKAAKSAGGGGMALPHLSDLPPFERNALDYIYMSRISPDPTNLGEVYLSQDPQTGVRLAVKRSCFEEEAKSADDPLHEAKILGRLNLLRHPFIIEYKGWFKTDDTFETIMEFCPMDFYTFVTEKSPSLVTKRTMMRGISEAVDFMHNTLYLAHLDLKLENILIADAGNGQLTAKLTDFGVVSILTPLPFKDLSQEQLSSYPAPYYEAAHAAYLASKPLQDEYARAYAVHERNSALRQADMQRSDVILQQLHAESGNPQMFQQLIPGPNQRQFAAVEQLVQQFGTKNYMAPEVCHASRSHQRSYDPRSADIWSLGVILFISVFGVVPYKMEQNNKSFRVLCQQGVGVLVGPAGYNLDVSAYMTQQAVDLLSHMLVYDPARRYTIRDVLSHPFWTASNVSSTHPTRGDGMDEKTD